jgi:hypothetical protein
MQLIKIRFVRKHNFNPNLQATCDVRGRFLDLSIIFPGSTSDLLAFEATWPGLGLGTGEQDPTTTPIYKDNSSMIWWQRNALPDKLILRL